MRHGDLKNFSKLKQQKCHKIQKKQSAKEKFAKNKPKNKQISIKTSPKISNPQIFKKTVKPQKKPEFTGKPQGWQH